MNGIERIAAERKRQIKKEGWTPDHDDDHDDGELALAASCYSIPNDCRIFDLRYGQLNIQEILWPWSEDYWKPNNYNRIRELEKAGALIAAEIDRLLRLKKEDKNG